MEPNQTVGGADGAEDAVNLRALFDMVKGGRWVILATIIFVVLLAQTYLYFATPLYGADALVQVETGKTNKDINSALGDQAELLGNKSPVSAELEIVRSRMVLGSVIDKLNLEIVSIPRVFPFFGAAFQRRHAPATQVGDVTKPPLGFLSGYCWGGETLELARLDVPSALIGKQLTLRVTADGFSIFLADGNKLFDGKAGEVASGTFEGQPVSVFVRRLIARPGSEFQLKRYSFLRSYNALLARLKVVERGTQSGIIAISLLSESRALAADTVRQIALAYQLQNVERRSAEAAQTLEFLKQQLPKLKDQLREAEQALNAYRSRNVSADISTETKLALDRSVSLETERLRLTQERQQLLEKFTAAHPSVKAVDAQIGLIDQQRGGSEAQIKALPDTQQQILRLTRDMEVATNLYTSLLNSAQGLEIARAGTTGNVRIIDLPVLADYPSSPDRRKISYISVAVGVILGTIAVFVLIALRRGVIDPAELERVVGLPTYASIPYSVEQRRLRIGGSRNAASRLLAVGAPSSTATESLRSLRTLLHFALLEAENNVLMLTGPKPEIGKSFISINLAAVLAISGRKVIVIDADLRRGRLHGYVDDQKSPGLSDYIVGADLPTVLRPTDVENLTLIPRGVSPPNPSELLMHPRFEELLKYCSENYDYVLVDTPPVLAVTDAAIIGRMAGCSLMVLKSAEHPMREIEEAINRLKQAGVTLRGVVFNQVGRSGINPYNYSYDNAYSYVYKYSSR